MCSRRQVKVLEESFKSREINWTICLICQQLSKEPLVQPTDSGYESLVKNLQEYAELEAIPSHLNTENLLHKFIENHGKYHKTCRTRFNSQKIDRLSRRKKPRLDEESLSPSQTTEETQSSQDSSAPSGERVTRSHLSKPEFKYTCFFCEEEEGHEKFVSAATLGIGPAIYEQALLLKDDRLLIKLTSNSDLVALEAKYHRRCYVSFLNRVRSLNRAQNQNSQERESSEVAYGSVLSELATFMQDSYLYSQTAPVFRLSNLVSLIQQRLQEFGFEDKDINRTRLKERLLAFIPGLREDKVGRDVVLSFEGEVHNAIRNACESNALSDGMCLARAVQILREDMFQEYPKFEGSFSGEFAPINCVTQRSLIFFRMLLEGATTGGATESDEMTPEDQNRIPNAAVSIAQLVRFNSLKRKRKESVSSIRHSQDKETPLPLYVGLMLYSQNTGADVIDKLFHLGLSVSYHRVKSVMNSVTSAVCKHYQQHGGVCPPNAASNAFTCAAIDNVDHDSSANTSVKSFHGTTISLIQFITENTAIPEPIKFTSSDSIGTARLPENYTTLPPTPKLKGEVPISTVNLIEQKEENFVVPPEILEWLSTSRRFAECEDQISWAAHFSRKEQENSATDRNKCTTILLPVLNHDINSPSVVRHAANIITTIVHKINPDQTPVITADQPVYALLKNLQWAMPDIYGESKIVIMLGSLHIEMAFESAIGTWLEGSGWTDNLVEAGVTTSGRAEGILKASHVKRSRYAHEVSITTLHILLERAYRNRTEDECETFESWVKKRSGESAQFKYWQTAIVLESLLLDLVRCIRQGNVADFISVLEKMCPWMFALNHTNYARWLPVFLHNLKQLPVLHPGVFREFKKGNISGSKTNRNFSRMAHDQIHEQNNKLVKSTSSNLSLLSQETGLFKWMIAGPEVVRMISEFEQRHDPKLDVTSDYHHEDTASFSKRFQAHVSALVGVFEEHVNPFEDNDLTTVNSSRIILPDECSRSVISAYEIGKKQFDTFVEDRLILRKVSIHDVIKRNNLPLMSEKRISVRSKNKQKIVDLRKDSSLFAKLYFASQVRQMDVKEFFAQENSSCPPSISELGKLRKPTKKSDVVSCMLQSSNVPEKTVHEPEVSALIIDGAALVHMLSPQSCRTFQQYCDQVFGPYVLTRLKALERVDIVFDQYLEGGLKNDTRESKGSGPRVSVRPNVFIPKSFSKFLANTKNKEELFGFLAKNIVKLDIPPGKQVLCTYKDLTIGSDREATFEDISPTLHEEADARFLLHVWHTSTRSEHAKVTIKTVDSDVVVIAMYAFSRLSNIKELWLEYGKGNNLQYLAIHELNSKISQGVPDLLPFFHAFTGADTVSAFAGIGKTTAWKTWMSFREVDKAFRKYTEDPLTLSGDDDSFSLIQRFVVLMYHSSSSTETVNEARRVLFTQCNRSYENIPPTSDVLLNHLKRATLQCSVWVNCLKRDAQRPDPCEWGWQKVGLEYEPLWSASPDITMEKLQELIACKCKKTYTTRCRCLKADLNCTLLCKCEGQCRD